MLDRLFLPSWRKLPSPFAPGMMHEVAEAIRENSLVHNPLFNAYFFRAAIHIIGRYSEPPPDPRTSCRCRTQAIGQRGHSALPEAETNFLAARSWLSWKRRRWHALESPWDSAPVC